MIRDIYQANKAIEKARLACCPCPYHESMTFSQHQWDLKLTSRQSTTGFEIQLIYFVGLLVC